MLTGQNSQNFKFADYTPAVLKEHSNDIWEIRYYVTNPYTEKLELKRNRVKKINNKKERKKLAHRMMREINARLSKGWNPFLENPNNKDLTTFKRAIDIYLKYLSLEVKDGNLRIDTLRTYSSRLKIFFEYLGLQQKKDIFCYQFNESIISKFLDYLRYDKNVSARTRDNYMTFFKTLSSWLITKKYISKDPCLSFKKTSKKKNSRVIIPKKDRIRIFNYFEEKNKPYLVMCMACYYCLVRRTELTKLKVGDVNLKTNTLFISAENSKNHKDGFVTIPAEFAILLREHIKGYKEEQYLFSDDGYKPGNNQFLPNKCTSSWSRMRRKINIDKSIKWYALKDSGITDLIVAGIPLNSVRDQARHHSIKQTDQYIPRSMKKADDKIKNSGIKF